MKCVNCGRENLEKSLICYWCSLDPVTGEPPYEALAASEVGSDSKLAVPAVVLPPAIEVPPPIPVPEISVGMAELDFIGLTMPDLQPIEIAPPPDIPDLDQFTKMRRRRARHRPIVRAAPSRPKVTRPVLPGMGRLMVFVGGLGLLFVLGSALVAAVGATSLGSAFCLLSLFGLVGVLWGGLLLARTGRRIATATGVAYDRIEVLGRALREVVPGVLKELPVNLPNAMDVLDSPAAYSELRRLSSREGEPLMDLTVDLLSGSIASLASRDDVILARRTYPLEVRGLLTRPASEQVERPVITRRRVYAGPGELERQLARILRTDRSMTVEELMRRLVEPGGRQGAQRLLNWVDHALSENPPKLETLDAPDAALAELEQYREALRRADPELYELLEEEIRRGLGAIVRRSVPSSLLDLAQYASTGDRSRQTQPRTGPK